MIPVAPLCGEISHAVRRPPVRREDMERINVVPLFKSRGSRSSDIGVGDTTSPRCGRIVQRTPSGAVDQARVVLLARPAPGGLLLTRKPERALDNDAWKRWFEHVSYFDFDSCS
jgi:hypothetical protein